MLRVTSALAPGAIGLVSKVPPRSVAVWGRWPVLDQVTLVPAATVSSPRGEVEVDDLGLPAVLGGGRGRAGGGGRGRGGQQDQAGQGEQGQQAEGAHVGYLAVT